VIKRPADQSVGRASSIPIRIGRLNEFGLIFCFFLFRIILFLTILLRVAGGVMKSSKSSLTFKSFQDLEVLLKKKSFPARRDKDLRNRQIELTPELEEKLFKEAMEGVTPIPKGNYLKRNFQIELPEGPKNKDDAEALKRLADLIRYGTGFNVSDTPEYMEGTGYNVPPSVARRLHRGDFSIQAYVDLHGLRVDDAKEAFEEFLNWAVTTGKRGVLIVHGRGLSSPSEPILKNKVREWLTRGLWRKWVVAYSSARNCDGGAGATYVLLRQRPLSKRQKIKRSGDGRP
jgi:DNA-nicking Smr family endonuclease